jgi:hypothetical protein
MPEPNRACTRRSRRQLAAPTLLVASLATGCGYVSAEVHFLDPSRVSVRSENGFTLPPGRSPASVTLARFTTSIRSYDLVAERHENGSIALDGTVVDDAGTLRVGGRADPVPKSMLEAPELVIPLCWYYESKTDSKDGRAYRNFRPHFEACADAQAFRVYVVSPWDNVDWIRKGSGGLWDRRGEVIYGCDGSACGPNPPHAGPAR